MTTPAPHESTGDSGDICPPECAECLRRQAREAIALTTAQSARVEAARAMVERFLDRLDWRRSPPALAQHIHAFIRQAAGCPDPYARLKTELNQRAARLFPEWRQRFHAAFPPLEAAVRMAIVGNLLDVGAKIQVGEQDLLAALDDALKAPLLGSIDGFAQALREADGILYLADNAGEIVFDRDLLAQLPLGSTTIAVRGGPILNDATLADAQAAGLTEFGDVIANGSDAPGTVLEDCSPAFRDAFAAADLVIAKGQGNLESLAKVDRPVFHLLKVKCAPIARALACPVGSLVLHHHLSRLERLG